MRLHQWYVKWTQTMTYARTASPALNVVWATVSPTSSSPSRLTEALAILARSRAPSRQSGGSWLPAVYPIHCEDIWACVCRSSFGHGLRWESNVNAKCAVEVSVYSYHLTAVGLGYTESGVCRSLCRQCARTLCRLSSGPCVNTRMSYDCR